MTLTGVIISTDYEYPARDDEDHFSGTRVEYLKLEIPIPGRMVVFKYKISKAEVDALEKAVTIGAKVK